MRLGGGARWHLAARGALNGTQWVRVARNARGGTRRRHLALGGALALGGTQRFSVLRAGGRARAVACIVTLVGAQLCSCRSVATGTRRHSVALNGAGAVARWHESWHSATLLQRTVAQRHTVERGGMRQAASRSDTARWRSVARRCVHPVALSGIRWRSAAGVGLRGRFGASQNRLAGLLRRSSADQR